MISSGYKRRHCIAFLDDCQLLAVERIFLLDHSAKRRRNCFTMDLLNILSIQWDNEHAACLTFASSLKDYSSNYASPFSTLYYDCLQTKRNWFLFPCILLLHRPILIIRVSSLLRFSYFESFLSIAAWLFPLSNIVCLFDWPNTLCLASYKMFVECLLLFFLCYASLLRKHLSVLQLKIAS